ncbi:MAG TPA: flagellar biosynthetic protein FliO [Acetobacteraceae bacterium]
MSPENYLRFALALVFVIGLIVLAGYAARRLGFGGAPARTTGKQRRIGIVEVVAVDAKRRLVLVRRDGVEHLVLLGPGNDLVLETGIRPGTGESP